MGWTTYVAEKKWRNSVFRENLSGRFLHGPPLKLGKSLQSPVTLAYIHRNKHTVQVARAVDTYDFFTPVIDTEWTVEFTFKGISPCTFTIWNATYGIGMNTPWVILFPVFPTW